MKKIFLTSLFCASFSVGAIASQTPQPNDAVKIDASQVIAKEKAAPKGKKHFRMSKPERLAHHKQTAGALMADLTEQAKTLTGAYKKIVDLNLAHAKLELDAAQDEELKGREMTHLNKAKRFLKNAKKIMMKTKRNVEKSAGEALKAENTKK